ncbi:hypothetical protein N7488_011720 [Penicillium malachiteum]|nr:hypothetical protein N7488_011720 [Penicillium malachiteum]
MLQPSGRVCGFDPQLRFYLRGSPIVCVLDLLGLLWRFTSHISRGTSALDALRHTLETRNLRSDRGPAGLRHLHEVPYLRLGVFAIAGSQAVKLLACDGIPWTEIWVYCYMIPVVVIEILTFIEPHLRSEVSEKKTDDRDIDSRIISVNESCQKMDQALGITAIYAQWLIFFVCSKVTLLFLADTSESQPDTLQLETAYSIRLSAICFFLWSYLMAIACIPNLIVQSVKRVISSIIDLPTTGRVDDIFRTVLYGTGAAFVYYFVARFPQIDFQLMMQYFALTPVVYGLLWAPTLFLAGQSAKFKAEVLFLFDPLPEDKDKNHLAFHNLLFFVSLLGLSLTGYGLVFDSKGTYKPTWAWFLG